MKATETYLILCQMDVGEISITEAHERILKVFNNEDVLPDFLYEDDGEIKIGYHGDMVVTDEWNKWKCRNQHDTLTTANVQP